MLCPCNKKCKKILDSYIYDYIVELNFNRNISRYEIFKFSKIEYHIYWYYSTPNIFERKFVEKAINKYNNLIKNIHHFAYPIYNAKQILLCDENITIFDLEKAIDICSKLNIKLDKFNDLDRNYIGSIAFGKLRELEYWSFFTFN